MFAPSNEAFDEDLKRRDPRWGLRWLEDVEAVADTNGLVLERVVEMPANNLTVVFRKRWCFVVDSSSNRVSCNPTP